MAIDRPVSLLEQPGLSRRPVSFKRPLDVTLAAIGLAAAAPLMAAIALAVRLDSPGDALYRQERVGRFGRPFTLYKFRTMAAGCPELPTDQMKHLPSQVTRLGHWLRRASLDELPQLWNVLVGDMSLVGPRPALAVQTDLVAGRARLGIDALSPGLTGWAQINGRDEITLEQKIAYDAWYAERLGLRLDLLILWRTCAAVFTGHGAY